MATNKPDIEVTPRTVYPGRGRRYRVFDAVARVNGERYSATARTAKEARAALLADIEYVSSAGRLVGHGCKLYAQGRNEWCFDLPSGCVMCFGAADLHAALEHVRNDYRDHPDCESFFITYPEVTR